MPSYSVIECMGKQYYGAHTMLQTIIFLGHCPDENKEKVARRYCEQIRGEIKLSYVEYDKAPDLSLFHTGTGFRPVNMVLSEDMQTVSYNRIDKKKVSVVDGKFVITP